MPVLVALDEGSDIPIDRAVMVVGRHPQCDARLDSIRVSRRHCCMTADQGEVVVRDLGSTNGIRINGERVEVGRLRPGDELSIAHIRYRLDDNRSQAHTLADPVESSHGDGHHIPFRVRGGRPASEDDNPLAAAVRDLLPSSLAEKCRIQVIVHMKPEDGEPDGEAPRSDVCPPD
jgi:predicted component of type VI protein secretion system